MPNNEKSNITSSLYYSEILEPQHLRCFYTNSGLPFHNPKYFQWNQTTFTSTPAQMKTSMYRGVYGKHYQTSWSNYRCWNAKIFSNLKVSFKFRINRISKSSWQSQKSFDSCFLPLYTVCSKHLANMSFKTSPDFSSTCNSIPLPLWCFSSWLTLDKS